MTRRRGKVLNPSLKPSLTLVSLIFLVLLLTAGCAADGSGSAATPTLDNGLPYRVDLTYATVATQEGKTVDCVFAYLPPNRSVSIDCNWDTETAE